MEGKYFKKYLIIKQLGQGHFATVYKAFDPNRESNVAIKILRSDLSNHLEILKIFRKDIELSMKLIHPNIVYVIDYGDTDILYMVYPFIDGESLKNKIQNGPMPLNEVSSILNQIASALDHIHRHDILHCDLKPINIQLDRTGKAYLVDFGNYKLISDNSLKKKVPNPGYAPLEAYSGNFTESTDIYSLGVCLYEMVTGRPPFQAREAIVRLMKQKNDPILLPSNLRPDLPQLGENVILKALAQEPGSRYQTAGAMASAFAEAIRELEPTREYQRKKNNTLNINDGDGIQYYSCFISYSTKDEGFAQKLHDDLQENGVRCWFAPHDIQAGKKIHEQIDRAIRVHDRLLLILSKHSMKSEWVKTEIANTRQKEIDQDRQVLFPISIVDYEQIKNWKCFDADRGKDSAREIREYFIPDFSNWQDEDAYKEVFKRLLRDLKAAKDNNNGDIQHE